LCVEKRRERRGTKKGKEGERGATANHSLPSHSQYRRSPIEREGERREKKREEREKRIVDIVSSPISSLRSSSEEGRDLKRKGKGPSPSGSLYHAAQCRGRKREKPGEGKKGRGELIYSIFLYLPA